LTNLPLAVTVSAGLLLFLLTVVVTIKLTLLASRLAALRTSARTGDTTATPIAVAPPYLLVQARHGWMLANPHDVYLGRAIVDYGEYGEHEGLFLARLLSLRPGKVVEIGANVGTHTVQLAKALAAMGREMIAIEPQPFLFQNLCANLALNGLTNVAALQLACGDENRLVFFPSPDYKADNNFGAISAEEDASPGSIGVRCVRLDDVVGAEPVALLKIDVEGYELLALQGSSSVLTQSRPVLYVENDRVENSQALIEWLWAQNYRLYWHIPHLFNSDNFFKNETNAYGNAASFNMLGLPRELDLPMTELREVDSASYHPLVQ